MSNTISIPATKLDKILNILVELKQEVSSLNKKVEDLEPVYGSDAWWEWSDNKAMEDIRAGRFVELRDKMALQAHLDMLKSE